MRRAHRKVALGFVAAFAAGCVAGPAPVAAKRPAPRPLVAGEEILTASGTAHGTGVEAYAQATSNAKRKAVATALALIVPDEPDGPDDPRSLAVRRHVLDRWRNYVRPGARVVSRNEADGSTTVTLRVVVMTDAIAKEAARVRRELDPKRKPRVVVAVFPASQDGAARHARAAERAVVEAFASRGLPLVERVPELLRREMAKALRDDDPAALARSARSVGAEVAVVGFAARTRERETEVHDRKLEVYTPTVALRAVDTASGREVFSRSHPGEESVGDEALANAANDLAEECLTAVLESWRVVPPTFVTAVVRVEGASFEDFARFVRLARAVRGVAVVRGRPFSGEAGEIEIDHARDPLDLARDLTRLEGLSLRLLSASAEAIRLRAAE